MQKAKAKQDKYDNTPKPAYYSPTYNKPSVSTNKSISSLVL